MSLGIIFNEDQTRVSANNSLGKKNSCVNVQTLNCGSDTSKDVLKQLSQINQKLNLLNVLERKVDSLSPKKSESPCARGKNAFLIRVKDAKRL